MDNKQRHYAPGMRVVVRDEEWVIRRADDSADGGHLLTCEGISELVRGREGRFLTQLEQQIDILDPAGTRLVEDDSPNYQAAWLYLESQLRRRLPTDARVHFGHKAAMDPLPFQLDPTLMALRQPRQRILIADSVGLGKTLEAGILVSELIRRGRGKRILVLAVKSMLTQFQKEFWSRFAIPLTRLDSTGLQRVRNRIPTNHNPFHYYDKAIISIDTLKQDVEYRHHLENAYWDIIVIDEAHNVAERGSNSQRSRLARLLARRSDTLIMLSATPHDGKPESFASLLNMLDATAIANPSDYEYADFADKHLVVRRFKKDVKSQMAGEFPERHIACIKAPASPQEEEVYRRLLELELKEDDEPEGKTAHLLKVSLEKALFSSPMACQSVVQNRLRRLQQKQNPALQSQIGELESFALALGRIDAGSFSKYRQLLDTISTDLRWQPRYAGDRLVIFTESIKTLEFLHRQLTEDLGLKPEQIAMLHGAMADTELMNIVEEFGKEKSPLRLLVCSDVASEGINLHHQSHKLIHFDIPWSLMVFQQRNGRVDRYGQQHQPQIRYLLTESDQPRIRGDQRILEILIEKDEQAQKNIGDSSEFTRRYDQESEEQQVADFMLQDEGIDAAALFADLLDGNAESPGSEDPLAALGGNMPVTAGLQEVTAALPSLFGSEAAYCESALRHLRHSGQPLQYERLPNGVISLVAPQDLRLRFGQLPPEIRPEHWQLQLSDQVALINQEIQRCRGEQHAWPAIHYLWQINPVVQWLDDKMQSAFGRHQAPLVRVPGHLSPDEDVFILSGLYPNRQSHPMVNPWLAVIFERGEFSHIVPLEQFYQAHPWLGQPAPNPGGQRSGARQQTLLAEAIDKAGQEFARYRANFEQHINERLSAQLEQLDRLRARQLRQLEQDFAHSGQVEPLLRARREQRQREIERNFDDYLNWIQDTMTTEKTPYIQLMAVLTGAEG